jgi:glycosyltransferase involved in cell wall biosynthesis
MKILFFSRLFHPHIGGIERHLEEVSLKLISKGHEVTILTTKYDERLKDEEIYKNIKVIRFSQPKIKFIGLLYTWYWLIQNRIIIKNYDIVHIHDVFIWYWPFRLLFSKKVFITFHGQWGHYPLSLSDVIQKKIGQKLSSGNICIGEYIPKHYGIKADLINYGATKAEKKVGKKDDNRIMYIGRLDKELTLQNVLRVLKSLTEHEIDFCGDGEMKGECGKVGKVHGFVDPERYYTKAKYCFASGYLTILESLASKCLTFVVYDHPLKRDYYSLAPFSKFIVIGKDSNDLLKKFRYYENNPEKAKNMIVKGYNWVINQTWDKMTNDYLRLWGINEKYSETSKKTR